MLLFLNNVGLNRCRKYQVTLDPDKMPENLECVITIGGDGTLLQAAQDLDVKLDVVFLGINKGTLGFLAEVCAGRYRRLQLYRLLNGQILMLNHE